MPRKTRSCIDICQKGPCGKPAVGKAREGKSEADAIHRADSLYATGEATGSSDVLEAEHDPDDYSEPRLLARHGETPGS